MSTNKKHRPDKELIQSYVDKIGVAKFELESINDAINEAIDNGSPIGDLVSKKNNITVRIHIFEEQIKDIKSKIKKNYD